MAEQREQTIERLDREWWQESALLRKHFGADLKVLLRLAYDAGAAAHAPRQSEQWMTEKQYETLWSAVSKLESQVLRNEGLPEYYRTVCRDAFQVLRDLRIAEHAPSSPVTAEVERLKEALRQILPLVDGEFCSICHGSGNLATRHGMACDVPRWRKLASGSPVTREEAPTAQDFCADMIANLREKVKK